MDKTQQIRAFPAKKGRRTFVGAAVGAGTLAALGVTAGLCGCVRMGAGRYSGSLPPKFTPFTQVKALNPAPRNALVLGSGGPRGFAHIGVLRALEEVGYKPDLIIGASVGSLVGALYAAGYSSAQLYQLAMNLSMSSLIKVDLLSPSTLRGDGIADWVNQRAAEPLALRGEVSINQLPVKYAAVAVRVSDRALGLMDGGDLGACVQASCAIAGRFHPLVIKTGKSEQSYEDPDALAPLPAQVARQLGAQRVVAVDISAHLDTIPPGAPAQWRAGDEAKQRASQQQAPFADLVLHPDIGYYAGGSQEYAKRVIELAYNQCKAKLAVQKQLTMP